MSTNYYQKINCCKSCNRSDNRHIGLYNMGWKFKFRGYPNIRSWEDWKRELASGEITDERGMVIPLADFEAIIASTEDGMPHRTIYPFRDDEDWEDENGHQFGDYDFS